MPGDDKEEQINNQNAVKNVESQKGEQAAVDKVTKKIVTVSDVLNQNQEIAFKLNNLLNLGVSMEQIENLVTLSTGTSVVENADELAESIDSVLSSIVSKISLSLNGIVLNQDGTVDHEASQIQTKQMYELGLISSIEVNERLEKIENFVLWQNENDFTDGFIFRLIDNDKSLSSYLNIDSVLKDIADEYSGLYEKDLYNYKSLNSVIDSDILQEANGVLGKDTVKDNEEFANILYENFKEKVMEMTPEKLASMSSKEQMAMKLAIVARIKDSGADFDSVREQLEVFIPDLPKFSFSDPSLNHNINYNEDHYLNDVLKGLFPEDYEAGKINPENMFEYCEEKEGELFTELASETLYYTIISRLEEEKPGTKDYQRLENLKKSFANRNPDLLEFEINLKTNPELSEMFKKGLEVKKNAVVSRITNDSLNKINEIGIKNLNESQKKAFIPYIVLGASLENGNEQFVETLQKLNPSLKLAKEGESSIYGFNLDDFGEIFRDYFYIGKNEKFDKDAIESKVKFLKNNLVKIESDRMLKSSTKISDHEIDNNKTFDSMKTELDATAVFDFNIDITKTSFQRAFGDTDLNITDKDEEEFNRIYMDATNKTWIESKEDAVKLAIVAFMNKEKTVKDPRSKKICQNKIARFIKEDPESYDVLMADKEEFARLEVKLAEFELNKFKSMILDRAKSTYLNEDFDFNSLKSGEKSDYLNYALLARSLSLKLEDPSEKKLFGKLADRSLELISSKENPLISIGKDGKSIVNEEALMSFILKNKNKDPGNNLQEIMDNVYNRSFSLMVPTKLSKYAQLDENQFVTVNEADEKVRFNKIIDIKTKKSNEAELRRDLVLDRNQDVGLLRQDQSIKLLVKFGLGRKEANDYINKFESKVVNSFINETLEDVSVIKALVNLNKENIDPNSKEFEEYVNIIQSTKDSIFYDKLVDKNGKYDHNKAKKFFEEFKTDRDIVDINKKMNRLLLDDHYSQEETAVILARAATLHDKVMDEKIKKVAADRGIDVLDSDRNVDFKKIRLHCIDAFGRNVDMKALIDNESFIGDKALKDIEKIEETVNENIKNGSYDKKRDVYESIRIRVSHRSNEDNKTNKKAKKAVHKVITESIKDKSKSDVAMLGLAETLIDMKNTAGKDYISNDDTDLGILENEALKLKSFREFKDANGNIDYNRLNKYCQEKSDSISQEDKIDIFNLGQSIKNELENTTKAGPQIIESFNNINKANNERLASQSRNNQVKNENNNEFNQTFVNEKEVIDDNSNNEKKSFFTSLKEKAGNIFSKIFKKDDKKALPEGSDSKTSKENDQQESKVWDIKDNNGKVLSQTEKDKISDARKVSQLVQENGNIENENYRQGQQGQKAQTQMQQIQSQKETDDDRQQ